MIRPPLSTFQPPAPAFTVLCNLRTPNSVWVGTSWEFFDSHGAAAKRYYELEQSGHVPTIRPFHDETDRPHMGAVHKLR